MMAERKARNKKVRLSGVSDASFVAAENASVEIIDGTPLKKFTLSSGRDITFRLRRILAENVRTDTYVIQDVNGREQSALTEESVADITRL
jgi:hypothetical protein